MAQYPPPPQPDQNHYNALYPTTGSAQQLLDHQSQLSYNNLDQSLFSKSGSNGADEGSADRPLDTLAQELQHQADLAEQQRMGIQQAVQQNQQPGHESPSNALPQQEPSSTSADQSQKVNRLRKACDSCSIRKVKCDESGPPCRACRALEIPCTFERPSRRRGPPNRHAEVIKKRRLENPADPFLDVLPSAPSSPTHAAEALAALSSHAAAQPISAESICPVDTISLLIDDFFTYLHPICPFPHEPSFREAWRRREDLNNKRFLALLASMMAAISAVFPRKPRSHFKYTGRSDLFPNTLHLTNRCIKICSVARGPGYLESENLNVYDAATSHFLGLASGVTAKRQQANLYYGECLTILRALRVSLEDVEQQENLGGTSDNNGTEQHKLDNITTEIDRRIFWTMFINLGAGQQATKSPNAYSFPQPFPAPPAEVDDFCIYPSHNEEQPAGLLPTTIGFNAIMRIYKSYTSLISIEHSLNAGEFIGQDRQRQILRECLEKCKSSISDLPAELAIRSISHNDGATVAQNGSPSVSAILSQALTGPMMDQLDLEQSPEQRRQTQLEVQKGNIYASYLATRAYLLTRYLRLEEVQGTNGSADETSATRMDGKVAGDPEETTTPSSNEVFAGESERIARDLLVFLTNVDAVSMEPNASGIAAKLRSIAQTLLSIPEDTKGPLLMKSQPHLTSLLEILSRLDRQKHLSTVPNNGDIGPQQLQQQTEEGEEAETRAWVELREFQRALCQKAGELF